MEFITSAARLFADTMAVPQADIRLDSEYIIQVLGTVTVPDFSPKSKVGWVWFMGYTLYN